MSELLLKIGGDSNPEFFQDGDIIHAFNQLSIKHMNSSRLCHVKLFAKNKYGLNIPSIARSYLELTSLFRVEAIGSNLVRKTDLVSNSKSVEVFPLLDYWLTERLKHHRHRIFGTKGREVWYEGNKRINDAVMENVWTMIHAESSHKEADHALAPLGTDDKKLFLSIKINDFTSTERESYESPEYTEKDGQFTLVKKRKRKIDWEALSLPVTSIDIRNRRQTIDIRGSGFILDKSIDIITKI